jgi:hypothetical protein
MAVLLPVVICTAIVDTDELSYFRIKVIINTYSSYTMTLMMCGAKSVKSKGIVTPNTSRDCRYPPTATAADMTIIVMVVVPYNVFVFMVFVFSY